MTLQIDSSIDLSNSISNSTTVTSPTTSTALSTIRATTEDVTVTTDAAKHPSTPKPTPAPTPPVPTVLPFVAQFPISTHDFPTTLSPHIGQKYPKNKFAEPTAAIKANITAFLTTLTQYDAAPSAALVTKLNTLMSELKLSAIRVKESSNDSVIFYPNDVAGKDPITCGGVLTWKFGPTAQFNVPGGIPQFFVFDPHSGQDGTLYSVTSQFLAGAKALLSHAFNPNVAVNPNFKGNPITPTNTKRYSDPAHSETTAFVPFVTTLHQLFPHAGCTVTHGMAGKPNFQLIANNDRTAQLLQDGTRDWVALLGIALGIQNMPINPNIAVIEALLPGYVVNQDGTKAPLISINDRNSPLRLNPHVSDNTDAVGHMANGAQDPFQLGHNLDNAFFVEFGPDFRAQNSKLMPLFAAAQAQAEAWYMAYDPTIHDPWMLAKRFPAVYNNMKLYPNLFDPKFMQAYKQNGTNPYNTSSSAAAVADQNAMLASLANAASTSVEVRSDLTPEVELDASPTISTSIYNLAPKTFDAISSGVSYVGTTISSAASSVMRPLTFSKAATDATSKMGGFFATQPQDANATAQDEESKPTLKVK